MKKVGIGLAIIVVLLLGTLLVVPGFMDWNQYKSQIEEQASRLTGRNVRIAGDISLSILPSPALSAGDVSVSNIDGGIAAQMLTLKALDVKVAFFPLIRGNIKVKKFILVEPVLALELLADGRTNWDFSDPNAPAEKGGGADLSLEKFQISNGTVSYEDVAAGRKELLRNINADLSISSLQGPVSLDGKAKYKDLPLAVALEMGKMRDGRKVPLTLEASYLGDKVTGKFIGGALLDSENGELDGKLSLAAKDLSDLVDVMTALGRNGEPDVPAVQSVDYNKPFSMETGVKATPSSLTLSELDLTLGETRGQASLNATLGERISFDGKLALNSIELEPFLKIMEAQAAADSKAAKLVPAEQKAPDYSFLEQVDGTLDFSLGALKYNDKIASQISLKATAAGGQIEISDVHVNMPGGSDFSYAGAVSFDDHHPVLSGKLSLVSGNLRGLLEWLKVDISAIPSGRLTRFSFASDVRATEKLIQVYGISGVVDTSRFSGGLSYAVQDRLALGLDMKVDNVNLDSYLPARDPKAEPLDLKALLAPLGGFDANFILAGSNVTLQNSKVSSVRAEGVLKGGNLRLTQFDLKDMAGLDVRATGDASSLADTPRMSLDLFASAKDLGRLQRSLKLENGVDLKNMGAFSLTGTVKGGLDSLALDLNGRLGTSTVKMAGDVRAATLKQLPEVGSVDLKIDASGSSLSALIDQWNLPMTAPLSGDDRPVKIAGTVKGSEKMLNLDGSLAIAGGTVTFKGRTQAQAEGRSFDLATDVSSNDVRTFVRGLGVDFRPSRKSLGKLSLKSQLSGTEKNMKLQNIAGNIGTIKVNGSGALDLAGDIPKFDLTLTAGTIPLHHYLADEPVKKAGADKKWGDWSKDPIDLEPLRSVEGKATVTAASLTYNDYVFENPSFVAELKGGKLTIRDFTGRLFGGAVKMAGSLGGTNMAELDLDMSLTKASLSQATKVAGGISPVTGYFDFDGKFTGKGISQNALVSSLAGTGNLTASAGMINGLDIPKLSSQLSDMKSAGDFVKLLAVSLGKGQTPYKGGKSTITMKNGMAQFSPMDLELEGAKTGINLAVNMFQWKLDMDGSLSLVDHPDAPPLGLSATGAINSPKLQFQTSRIKEYVASKIASNMLQNMIGGNEGLKGIFGVPGTQQEGTTTEQAPAEEQPKETPENLGRKLLEKLFQKPEQKEETPPQ
ncbi:AsmA family protein [Emcibacter nanhaiensis]|uniref:AsmA family protein n=1 Tax=Emcibacter nanhaiensis TaxID=1505037 RepID=A0A501PCA4_9PROT|nr:AsmA family protein [Emcibacter nanhaiensis]TPD57596.1 AsmA family protein [Emcibacter nanhaiensis]